MVNLAIFASGSGTNFENIVKKQINNVNVKLLLVDKEPAYAIQRAQNLGIPWVYVNPKAFPSKKEYEEKIMEYLQEYDIELIALAGYMRYIGEVLLTHYDRRIVNIHPAYLPNFPGAHGIRDAYEAHAKETGVTIHYVDQGIDTGEIILQEKFDIDPNWSLETLEEHVHALEYVLYPKALEMLCKEETK